MDDEFVVDEMRRTLECVDDGVVPPIHIGRDENKS
jgi:hypothetical protein